MLVIDALLTLLLAAEPATPPPTPASLSPQALVDELSRRQGTVLLADQKKMDAERVNLKTERKALDELRVQLEELQAQLAKERLEMDAPRQELDALRQELDKLRQEQLTKQTGPKTPTAPTTNILLVAKTFQGMKADKIGAVLAQMDPGIAAAVVSKMKKDIAAKALETVKPEVAAQIALHLGSDP